MNATDETYYANLAYLIAVGLVDYPEELQFIQSMNGANSVLVQAPGLHRKSDHGKLIGFEGKTYRALQTILRQAARLNGYSLILDINDPGGPYAKGETRQEDPNWPTDRDDAYRSLLVYILDAVTGAPAFVAPKRTENATEYHIEDEITPDLLAALSIIWRAIGRNQGRQFRVFAWARNKAA